MSENSRIFFPVAGSLLAGAALGELAGAAYGFGKVIEVRFLNRSLNDTYLLVTEQGQKYILWVYRAGLRSEGEIEFELTLLQHLAGYGVRVAQPLTAQSGKLMLSLNAPEGTRYVSVFEFAEGRPPYADEKTGYGWGWTLAGIHQISDSFVSENSRPKFALPFLIDRPLEQIRFLFKHRPSDWDYLAQVAGNLKEKIAALDDLDWGICHNDYYENNMHLAEDGKLTVFDFDMCGFGWRGFDIATVWRDVLLSRKPDKFWEAFQTGYKVVRPLRANDLEAAKTFISIRHYWLLGLHASDVRQVGTAWMNDAHLDWWMKILRDWES